MGATERKIIGESMRTSTSENLILSYDLGGTNVRCGVLDDNGNIRVRSKTHTGNKPEPKELLARMALLADECCAKLGKKRSDLCAAGIGSPGPLNSQTGWISETPNLGWKDIPLTQIAREALDMNVYLENDANAALWGEYWKGAGVGKKTMFILTLGTGVGGSLILDGKLWRGPDDTAGHLGHMTIHSEGTPHWGLDNPGNVEALCSATACIRDAREAAKRHPDSLLAKIPSEGMTAAYASECADQGDPYAVEIFNRIGYYLGVTCATLANVFNPEIGIIGGGMAGAGDKIFVPLRKEIRRRALLVPGTRLEIAEAKLGDDAGLVGAAGLAFERYKTGER